MSLTAGTPRTPGTRAVAIAACALSVVTCSRSTLDVPPPLPPEPECFSDADCPDSDNLCEPVRCVDPHAFSDELGIPADVRLPPLVCAVIARVDCDDGDPCTEDTCEPATGICQYGPSTLDLDMDGHRAPLPGFEPGTPEACGDDCNDASAAAYPGNDEICDGVDNDCNGVVDDGADFIPLDDEPIRVSRDGPPYEVGGLAFNGDDFLAIYTQTDPGLLMYQTMITPSGTKIPPIEEPFTFQNADSAGGPIVWIGDRFGIAWQDRRDGNWESYFTILKPNGEKAVMDQRLSNALGFSVNVALAWNGSEFIVVWQDDRFGPFEIYGQRVSVDGVPLGENVSLSNPSGQEDEGPAVASGAQTIGVAYTNGVTGQQLVRFQTFAQSSLGAVSPIVDLSPPAGEAVYPRVTWNNDRYIVSWYERSGPQRAIFAVTVDEQGNITTPVTAISNPPPGAFSRDQFVLALGNRALFIYADNRDDAQGRYELYSRMVDSNLQPLGAETRLTTAPQDSTEPVAAFGVDGNVSVLFRDDRLAGAHHVWLTRLGCITATP